MHTAGQFKILQRQLETILERVEPADTERMLGEKHREEVYERIKECIILHHELIWYSEKMEKIFMYTTLCQLLVSGIMLCVAGFQVFLVSIYTHFCKRNERERERGEGREGDISELFTHITVLDK